MESQLKTKKITLLVVHAKKIQTLSVKMSFQLGSLSILKW